MEEQLKNKMLRHELDDIDMDMIKARLKAAHSEIVDILNELNKSLSRLRDLCRDKKDEMALLDFKFVLACDDKIIHDKDDNEHDGVPCLCTFGSKAEIEGLLRTIQKVIDS